MKKITISGIIGWDTTPQQLCDDLSNAKGDDVEITISSPGGFVGDGLEMFNLIRNYEGHTTARLSGYAMSMASYIPLAADHITAEDNAIYMIHNVRGGVWGDHNDILKYGEMTAGMSRMLGRAYAKHTGKSPEEIAAMMDAETFFFGQDMVDGGFVHEIIATEGDQDQQEARTRAVIAWEACHTKMIADVAAMQKDLTRAAALAGPDGGIPKPRAKATGKPVNQKEITMDVKMLKEQHPDLVAAVVAEAQTGMVAAAEVDQAKAAGATAERDRIAAVRAQAIPGHEALIETLAFDGKSTAADAALAIVAAEKVARTGAAADIAKEANKPVDGVEDDGSGRKPAAKAPGTETEIKAAWDGSADLQAEFGDFDTYKAYALAAADGLVKVQGSRK